MAALTVKIRVLIVDDSASMRMLIRGILSADPAIEIAGTAADGIEAVELVQLLKPDVVTLDVEMPRMDGIAALRQIMAKAPATRVIMISNLTQEGAKITFEALEAGAFSFVPKSYASSFNADLVSNVKAAAHFLHGRMTALPPPQSVTLSQKHPLSPVTSIQNKRFTTVGIGASTGGPVALTEVLSRIPANFPLGICIAIHMPQAYTNAFAERLNSQCAITVKEAANGDLLRPGVALIAPGGMHITLVRQGNGIMIKTHSVDKYPQYNYIPSVDLMMSSLADASGGTTLGVILTGMGTDGLKGMQQVKQKGGSTIAQDEATSVIFGMPKVCITGGVADEILPLLQIGPRIGLLGGV
jgi:two-component system chemotaxis response regulator CheB